MPISRNLRRGFSLVEIMLAVLVLAVLGLTIQGAMVSTLKGVRVDRLTEAKRHVALDLLEMLCQPYSPIGSLVAVPDSDPSPLPTDGLPLAPLTRELTVDETIQVLGIPADEGEILKKTLEAGYVRGFTLTWIRRIKPGAGDPRRTHRLDTLWVAIQVTQEHRGPRIDSFRVFYMPNAS